MTCVTVNAFLVWNKHRKASRYYILLNYAKTATVCQKAIQGLCLNKINRALIGLLLAKMLGHAHHKTAEQRMTQFKEKPQQIRKRSADVSVI